MLGNGILLFVLCTSMVCSERVVLTFVNSSVASEAGGMHPWSDSTIVKQYGRRLVLSLETQLVANYNSIEDYYGGKEIVLAIENDVTISTSWVSRSSSAPNEYYVDIDTVEWQFASEEAYGMQVERLWQSTHGSSNTRVAVLDSGIASVAKSQGWFQNVEDGYDFISDSMISLDGNGRDANFEDPGDAGADCPENSWHGSKMAFAMAGKHDAIPGLRSVARNITIQPVRILGLCTNGYISDAADAIVWAAGGFINGVGRNPKPVDIISMSFAGRGICPSFLQSAINIAIKEFGVLLIVAAGNNETDTATIVPANCKGVISVAASTKDGTLASYSNQGTQVSISASGGDESDYIRTFHIESDNSIQLRLEGGTSYSTAFAAGFAALEVDMFKRFANDISIHIPDMLKMSTVKFRTFLDSRTRDLCVLNRRCGVGILSAKVIADYGVESVWNMYYSNITNPNADTLWELMFMSEDDSSAVHLLGNYVVLIINIALSISMAHILVY